MAIRARAILASLTLIAAIVLACGEASRAQPANNPGTGIGAGPSPIRPEFTRPGGTPGVARQTGEPERFFDPAQGKAKKRIKATPQ